MTIADIIQSIGVIAALIMAGLAWAKQQRVMPQEVLNMEAERAKLGQEIVRLSNENTAELLKRIDVQDNKIAAFTKLLDESNEKIQHLELEVSNLYEENERLREWGQANFNLVKQLKGTPIPLREPGTKPKLPRTLE